MTSIDQSQKSTPKHRGKSEPNAGHASMSWCARLQARGDRGTEKDIGGANVVRFGEFSGQHTQVWTTCQRGEESRAIACVDGAD